MRSSFYLKHDLDAREDDKMRALIMKMGARGYGIYWMLAEDLYRGRGLLVRDYAALAWAYHVPQQDVRAVAEDFALFYDARGKIACRRVDRDLDSRREASEKARLAGKASAVQRALNVRSTQVQPGEERRGRKGKERKEQPHGAPTAVDRLIEGIETSVPRDYYAWRFPTGFNARYAGAYLNNVPADECVKLLNTPRLGQEIRAALEWRIAQKKMENSR